jgi:hypothetical protein
MSAIIGISDLQTVHLLTDAAETSLSDGVVGAIHCKQIVTRCGAVVAGMGLWSPTLRFAKLADERAKTFNELVTLAPELWNVARAPLPASTRGTPYAMLLAGWSMERARVEMHVLQEIGADSGFTSDLLIYATGPAETDRCRAFTDMFSRCFSEDPKQFDPFRDGIAFMQEMRRNHLRKFEQSEGPAVGGYITYSAVTREGVETTVIHEWPDMVGQKIAGTKRGLSVDGVDHCPARPPIPTERDIEWALHKPARRKAFDGRFGRGAYDRACVAQSLT